MNIGLCYDLREDYLALGYSLEETAEFDKPGTIQAIEDSIKKLGFSTERIGNAFALVSALAQGKRWDLVFNIAEGLYGAGRESLVPALLDAYQIPYTFSDPAVLGISLHKGLAKRVARDLGIPTPDFTLVESLEDIARIDLPFPLFVKPVAEGTGKGISANSKVDSADKLREICRRLLEQHAQPVLVESYLPGRELTVGIVGTGNAARVLGVLEVCFLANAEAYAYSYENKENYEKVIAYRLCQDEPLAGECKNLALSLWTGLGCRDGGRVDIRADAQGKPYFLEVNPLAGLNPVHSDLPILCQKLGISFDMLIEQIMQSAISRLNVALTTKQIPR